MARRAKKLIPRLLFVYLVLFPFGQLFRLSTNIFGYTIRIHPTDLVVLAIAAVFLTGKFIKPKLWTHIKNFLYALAFSLVFSLTIFSLREVLIGTLYLVRVVGYSFFFLAVWNFVKNEKARRTLLNSLIGITLAISVFGLFQYFVYPDVRALYVWGWDDHLLRLVGTFLDPSFTSIFLVFGFLASLAVYLKTQKKYLILILGVFLFSIALTYSRAGYLALFSGAASLLLLNKNLKKILGILAIFLFLLALVPSVGSEGVRLLRTRSIFERIESYSDALALTSKSPVFGIGYNNLCIAKGKFLGKFVEYDSHACSGVESGALLILTTSGLVGILIFGYLGIQIFQNTERNLYGVTFLSSSLALLVHSLFVNSLLYPWVMGYLGILLSLSLKEKS